MRQFSSLENQARPFPTIFRLALVFSLFSASIAAVAPQAVSAEHGGSSPNFFELKNCGGMKVGIVGEYNSSTNQTNLVGWDAGYDDPSWGTRDNNSVTLWVWSGADGDWQKISEGHDQRVEPSHLGGNYYGLSLTGHIANSPPTYVRYEIGTDRPGDDYRCKGYRRVRL